MTTHIDNIITSCARVFYGLRTLRSHGMPAPALHAVYQSTALAKVTYMLIQLGGDSLMPWIGTALRPLSAKQLGMVTTHTLHLLTPRSVIKPIRHCLIA